MTKVLVIVYNYCGRDALGMVGLVDISGVGKLTYSRLDIL
jgi:hypothetical protein